MSKRVGCRLLSAVLGLYVFLGPACDAATELRLAEAQKVLASEKKDANALFSLSFFYADAGRPFSALKAIDRAIEVDPKVPGYYARKGQLLMARKRLKEAAKAYGKAADMDPATKSFRGAEARALAGCGMLRESVVAWKKLLDPTEDRKEVMDAARNLASIQQQLNNLPAAEAAWRTALGKLKEWNDRFSAATQASRLMVAQRAGDRAMKFWEELFAAEKNWDYRTQIAGQMDAVARDPFVGSIELAARARKCFQRQIESATDSKRKQRAATSLAASLLRDGQAKEAIGALSTLIFVGDWNGNHRAAQALARAHATLSDTKAIEKLWRDLLAKSPTYHQKKQVVGHLVALELTPEARIALRRDLVKKHPKEIEAHVLLARTLKDAKLYDEALKAYEAALPLSKTRRRYDQYHTYRLWQSMIEICAEARRFDQAVSYMTKSFASITDYSQVRYWLNSLRSRGGELAALKAARTLAESGGILRLGAAEYLFQSPSRDSSRPLFQAAGDDGKLKPDVRRHALQRVLYFARNMDERIHVARRIAGLGVSYWYRRRAYRDLASYLAKDGLVADGADVVRQADKVRQRHYTAGPDTLRSLGYSIFQGNRVGPGLRDLEGLRKAQAAALALYQEFHAKKGYGGQFRNLLNNLAELHARRGDYDGAVVFLRNACATHDDPQLHVTAAGLLDRKEDLDGAWTEYLAYVDAACKEHVGQLNRARRELTWFPSPNGNLTAFVKKHKKTDALKAHLEGKMGKQKGREREASGRFLLGYYKSNNKPEEMVALLEKMAKWGHKSAYYRGQTQWAQAAIRLKNATSRADTQRRDRLLKQVQQWKSTFAANPEDYQAAFNLYKTYVLLGRRKDGEPSLEKAVKVSPRDPIILERYGRELMLNKKYHGAAQAYAMAIEVTGRSEDYEKSTLSAYSLAGNHKAALLLALDSLEAGHHRGRGIRTVDQILDIAERSNNKALLLSELRKRIGAAEKAGKPLRERMARLAMRVGWENNDAEVAAKAVENLVALSNSVQNRWSEEWRLKQLATQAEQRRQLANAIRIRQALLTTRLAQGRRPNVNDYRELTMLLVQSDRSKEAADLMFDGLARVTAAHLSHRAPPVPWNAKGELLRLRPQSLKYISRPSPSLSLRQVRQPWCDAIISMAAQEARAGGTGFRVGCGERLKNLIEAEFALLKKGPSKYSGPLLANETATALELLERVSDVFRGAAAANGGTSEDHLKLAERLLGIFLWQTRTKAKVTVDLKEMEKAALAALEKAPVKEKGDVQMRIAGLYTRILGLPEKERPAGKWVEKTLDAYDAAVTAQPDRWGLDALRSALALAEKNKLANRRLGYAQSLQKHFPSDREVPYTVAGALLATGKVAEAQKVLKDGLAGKAPLASLRRAAGLCMTAKDKPEAARAAVEFLVNAMDAYLREVGDQVDAKGQRMPDREYGNLKVEVAHALAAAGKPREAMDQLLEAAKDNQGAALSESHLLAVAESYEKAGKLAELVKLLNERCEKSPKDLKLRLALASVLEKSKAFADAARAFMAAGVLKPELSTVKRAIANLRKAGDHRTALDQAKAWVASFPHDADAYRTLAAIHKDLKDTESEIRALTMLIEAAPRDAGHCRTVAVEFATRKDFGRAISLLERALELRPEEPYRHIDLAEVCLMAKHYPRAEKICKEALRRDWKKGLSPELQARMPDWTGTYEHRAHSVLADVYDATKRADEAAKARLQLPAGYKRPELAKAIPTPRRGGRWPRILGGLRR